MDASQRPNQDRPVIAVATTGIFCRPGCPAPAPKPQNVTRLPSARAALFAGYRACLRCRPLDTARPAITDAELRRATELLPLLAAARRVRRYRSGAQAIVTRMLQTPLGPMLAIAGALMCRPELLLVDELSLGLAPIVVQNLTHRLLNIRDELGIAILLVEQSAAAVLEIADYAYVMENGHIVLDGDRERLKGHQDVQEFYLGQAAGERRSYREVKQYRRSRRWYG